MRIYYNTGIRYAIFQPYRLIPIFDDDERRRVFVLCRLLALSRFVPEFKRISEILYNVEMYALNVSCHTLRRHTYDIYSGINSDSRDFKSFMGQRYYVENLIRAY